MAPNFNIAMFPIIFMPGQDHPEVVDIKDKGFSGIVVSEPPVGLLGQFKD